MNRRMFFARAATLAVAGAWAHEASAAVINPYVFGGPATPGLIDSFTSNLWGAYGLQRLLGTGTYSGSCIKVRRSSDNATQEIGFVGTALDTASLLTFVGANDGFIDTWFDQSGGGNHLTQATTTKQPQIVDAGAYIGEALFDGITQRLTTANSTSAVPAFSMYLAGRARLGAGSSSEVLLTQGGGPQLLTGRNLAVSDNYVGSSSTGSGSGGIDSALTADNTTYCAVIDTAGASVTDECVTYLNGSAQTNIIVGGTGISGNFAANTIRVGSDGGSNYARAAMQSILIYQAAHSAGTVGSISTLLRPPMPTDGLDSYTTNLWGLYSLRHQRTAYAGNCLRVRRSSDNAEQDIAFVGGFLDTAGMLTFVGGGNSGFVTTWYDQSGLGNNFTQTTAANQPRICASGVVDRGLTFDGSNDNMTTVNSGTPSAMTAFFKGNNEASPAVSSTILSLSDGYDSQGGMGFYRDTGNAINVGVGNNGSSAYAGGVFLTNAAGQVLCARVDRSQTTTPLQTRLYSGGALVAQSSTFAAGTRPTGNFTARPWRLGGVTTNYFMTGDVETVVLYEAAKTDADIERISRLIG